MKKRSNGNKAVLLVLIILLILAIYALYRSNISKNGNNNFDNNVVENNNGNKQDNNNNNDNNEKKDDNKENNNNDDNNQNSIVNNKTYLGKVVNSSGVTIKDEWQNVIVSYLDLYTKSLVNLSSEDVSSLFTNPTGNEAYLTNATIDFQVEHHKLQPNDMKLNDAKYDIEYKNVSIKGNKVTIKFLEDDYYKFRFMGNVTSRTLDVENNIVINKGDSGYTIDSLRVVRDNYVMFTNAVDTGSSKAKTSIDELKTKYLTWTREEVEKNKKLLEEVNTKEYTPSKACSHEYNRVEAVNYARKYADSRNSNYADYSSGGGNCANYASQSVSAGGIPMDYTGAYQWKYYSATYNDENKAVGRSNSWTSTSYFYNYAKNNTGYGMCADTDINIFYALGGDVIHVGYNGYTHTVIVIEPIKKDGKIVDIMINSNTVGLENFPLLSYTYQNKRLIKILGYND